MGGLILNPELKYASTCYYERAALRKLKLARLDTEALGVHALEVIVGGIEVTIGPVSIYSRGPNKGRRKYGGPRSACHKVLVTEADVQAEKNDFEAETGRCHNCFGNGLVVSAWSKVTGTGYKPCSVCATETLGAGICRTMSYSKEF